MTPPSTHNNELKNSFGIFHGEKNCIPALSQEKQN